MSHPPVYKHHIFFCTNVREDKRDCCGASGGVAMRDYAKQRLKSLPGASELSARVNSAGCMGRCDHGPVVAVYPEGTWYTYIDESDIDEIIDEHILRDRPVERLKI